MLMIEIREGIRKKEGDGREESRALRLKGESLKPFKEALHTVKLQDAMQNLSLCVSILEILHNLCKKSETLSNREEK